MISPQPSRGHTSFSPLDFDKAPFLVIWEVTQACDLACKHCRAEARPWRAPNELTTSEAMALLDSVRGFGAPFPFVVLTGGDPIKRPDIYDIVSYGHQRGLRMTMTPSGTPLITAATVRRLKESGLSRLAVSLDGSTAEIHDAFRQVTGSFAHTLAIIRWAAETALPVQIITTVTRYNLDDLDALAGLMTELGIVLWSVFFLVPTGRGQKRDEVKPQEYEDVFHKLYDLSQQVPFDIKTTEAQHYRRVVLQRSASARKEPRAPGMLLTAGPSRALKGVNAANGFVFVSHSGEVFPSGFLPVSAGNVRSESLVDIYRDAPLFQSLRDYTNLKGKCGYCEFRDVCGGSRSRAYAITGDMYASEPYCVYRPMKPATAAVPA